MNPASKTVENVWIESSKVGPQNALTLPEAVREALGVKEGDLVLFRLKRDGTVELTSAREVAKRARGLLAPLAPERPLVEELIQERREEEVKHPPIP